MCHSNFYDWMWDLMILAELPHENYYFGVMWEGVCREVRKVKQVKVRLI